MKTFEEWLEGYLAFQREAASFLSRPLPTELAQLHTEQQELEPLRWKAEGFAAAGAGRYYKAKAIIMEKYWSEVAKTALNDVAKAQCHKELWAREDSHGILDSVRGRIFAVNSQLKRIEP